MESRMNKYQPGPWAKKYRSLPRSKRAQVNRRVNGIFSRRTGVFRKLDPIEDPSLCNLWLQIRDEVMSGKWRSFDFRSNRNASHYVSAIGDLANSACQFMNREIERRSENFTPWLLVARQEMRKTADGFVVADNPDSPPRDQETQSDNADFTDDCEMKTKPCSRFVNWCLEQAGYQGTSVNWAEYGHACPEPHAGAIVVTEREDEQHVAFVDQFKGELRMLGGNPQGPAGECDPMGFQPINYERVIAYRWPSKSNPCKDKILKRPGPAT